MATSQDTLKKYLQTLQNNKQEWVNLALTTKIKLFQNVLDKTHALAEQQTQLAAKHKKVAANSHLVGEDWLNGPVVQCRTIRLIIETLQNIANGTHHIEPEKISKVNNNQIAVDVFPGNFLDSLMFPEFHARIWMQPDINKNNLHQHLAPFYQQKQHDGKVSLVLGAGNVASIGPLDVIQKLVEGHVVILKMNPVNEYLGPVFENTFSEFINQGYIKIVYGGGDVGEFLCQNDIIDDIHITGSDKTHDIICYGLGDSGNQAKQNNTPRLNKRITSELGNVSPIIVVPGQWSQKEIDFHAQNIATQLVNNAGFNCIAARMLILNEQWPQKQALLDALAKQLRALNARHAYYPGAKQKFDRVLQAHPDKAKIHGQCSTSDNDVPWTIIENLDPNSDSICFKEEAFCGLMAHTNIAADNVDDFLDKATNFCNVKLWGNLSASIIIHPSTQAKHQLALDQALTQLRYGSIALNHWPALVYALGSTPWGAYPGNTLNDIQSGTGFVHNSMLLDGIQKTVLYAPFTVSKWMPFMPAWFASNTAMLDIAKALCDMEHAPSFLKLPRLVYATLKGVWARHVTPLFNQDDNSNPPGSPVDKNSGHSTHKKNDNLSRQALSDTTGMIFSSFTETTDSCSKQTNPIEINNSKAPSLSS